MRLEPCALCDFIGPLRHPLTQAAADMHRSVHESFRSIAKAVEPLAQAIAEAQAEQRRVVKDAYTLAGPSKGDSK